MTYTTHADLGGQPGHGAVVPEPEGERFHAAWEPAALALVLAMGATGSWNIDMSRAARETLPDYARLSYYRDLAGGAGEADARTRPGVAPTNCGRPHAASAARRCGACCSARTSPAALAKGSPTARTDGPAARFARRPARAHARRMPCRTTRACPATCAARSASSSACTAAMSLPTRTRRAWASSRSRSTPWCSTARSSGARRAAGPAGVGRRLAALPGGGMTRDLPVPGLPATRRAGVRRALAGAGFRDGARAARARPVHLARVGAGAGAQIARGAGRRRRGRRRCLLPAVAGRAGSIWSRARAPARPRNWSATAQAWDHAADRTPHGQPIELQPDDFRHSQA